MIKRILSSVLALVMTAGCVVFSTVSAETEFEDISIDFAKYNTGGLTFNGATGEVVDMADGRRTFKMTATGGTGAKNTAVISTGLTEDDWNKYEIRFSVYPENPEGSYVFSFNGVECYLSAASDSNIYRMLAFFKASTDTGNMMGYSSEVTATNTSRDYNRLTYDYLVQWYDVKAVFDHMSDSVAVKITGADGKTYGDYDIPVKSAAYLKELQFLCRGTSDTECVSTCYIDDISVRKIEAQSDYETKMVDFEDFEEGDTDPDSIYGTVAVVDGNNVLKIEEGKSTYLETGIPSDTRGKYELKFSVYPGTSDSDGKLLDKYLFGFDGVTAYSGSNTNYRLGYYASTSSVANGLFGYSTSYSDSSDNWQSNRLGNGTGNIKANQWYYYTVLFDHYKNTVEVRIESDGVYFNNTDSKATDSYTYSFTMPDSAYFNRFKIKCTDGNGVSGDALCYIDDISIRKIINIPTIGEDKITMTDTAGDAVTDTKANVPFTLKSIALNFDTELDSATLLNITLRQGDTDVEFTVSVDSEIGLCTLNIGEELTGYKTYTITIPQTVTNILGEGMAESFIYEFTTVKPDVYLSLFKLVDENGVELSYDTANIGDSFYLSAEVKNYSDETMPVTLMLAKYCSDILTEADFENIELEAGGTYSCDEASDNGISVSGTSGANEYYKIYAFNSASYAPYKKMTKYYDGEEISILYNNKELDISALAQPALNIDGEKYVPLEYMADALGYTVSGSDDSVTLAKESETVTLTKDGNTAIIRDGKMLVRDDVLGELLSAVDKDVTEHTDKAAFHTPYYSEDDTFFNLNTTFIGDDDADDKMGDPKTMRGFSWQAKPGYENMVLEYSEGETLSSDVKYAETEKELCPVVYRSSDISSKDDPGSISYYENMWFYKADITGLKPGTTYSYRIGDTAKGEWSEIYSFTTETEDTDSFSIIAVADTQGSNVDNYSAYKDLLTKATDDADASFLVHMGDITDNGVLDDHWDMYFDASKGIGESLPIVAAVGNHETRVNGTKYYNLHFNNPQNGTGLADGYTSTSYNADYINSVLKNLDNTVYSFDYGTVHFAVVNTGTDWVTGSSKTDGLEILNMQKEWLTADMAAADSRGMKWKVLIMHMGVYPAQDRTVAQAFYTTVDECGIDYVMQGHDHITMRTKPMKNGEAYETDDYTTNSSEKGTVYAIMGCGAKKRYGYGTSVDFPEYEWLAEPPTETATENPSYNIITFSDDKIEVTAKYLTEVNGSDVITSYTIIK